MASRSAAPLRPAGDRRRLAPAFVSIASGDLEDSVLVKLWDPRDASVPIDRCASGRRTRTGGRGPGGTRRMRSMLVAALRHRVGWFMVIAPWPFAPIGMRAGARAVRSLPRSAQGYGLAARHACGEHIVRPWSTFSYRVSP
jgi:hypothetical protein